MGVFYTLLLLLSVVCILTQCREHKVHNIVLYPDKQSWCKTTPIRQVVAEPGYESAGIDNSVCVGTCFSYSVPLTSDLTITPYCDSCQPSDSQWYHVTLQKLSNADEELSQDLNRDFDTPLPDKIQKRVQIITNCTCLNCNEQLKQRTDDNIGFKINTTELPDYLFADRANKDDSESNRSNENNENNIIMQNYASNLNINTNNEFQEMNEHVAYNSTVNNFSSPFEVPELLQLANRTNQFKHGPIVNYTRDSKHYLNVSDVQRYYLNSKLINLLKNIQSSNENETDQSQNNFNYDKELLKELLEIIEGSEHKLNDKNLMEFVNFVNVYNSEDFELDLSTLKKVLIKFENKQYGDLKERHRHFGLGHSDLSDSDSIEYKTEFKTSSGNSDLLEKHKNYALGILPTDNMESVTRSTERPQSDEYGIEGSHLGLNHLKGSHIGMGIKGRENIYNTNNGVHDEKHHFNGEKVDVPFRQDPHVEGHLVPGPHGSLVIKVDDKTFSGKHHNHNIEEKLNVEPDLLRPNHAGIVLHYESHIKDKHKVMTHDD